MTTTTAKPSARSCEFVATLGDVAWVLGEQQETVRKWRTRGMPGAPGRWSLRQILLWKRNRDRDPERQSLSRQTDAQLTRRKREAETILAERKARLLELDTQEREQQLILRDQVRLEAMEFVSVIKASIEGIPEELSMSFPRDNRDDLTDQVQEKIWTIMRRMAGMKLNGESRHSEIAKPSPSKTKTTKANK